MQILDIIEAWETNTLPTEIATLETMKAIVHQEGVICLEACQITDNVTIAEILIREHNLYADIHATLDKWLRAAYLLTPANL